MIRKIININEEKCNGCGACAEACHEGAIAMIDGKAKLIRDDYCDGLGDCLPTCPTGAITFVERETVAYDAEAVKKNMEAKKHPLHQFGGCLGHQLKEFKRSEQTANNISQTTFAPISQLGQWPCQIKLIPKNAPCFDNAKLLIAADCTAYAYANIHNEFMKGKVTLIGCPKLDDVDYSEKLTPIIKNNNIQSITVIRMEVPCCGGIEQAIIKALKDSGKFIPWQVVNVSIDGNIIE